MAENRMPGWAISLSGAETGAIASENHTLVSVPSFLNDPESVISSCFLQNFAKITPQYPGIRASLEPEVCAKWLSELAPMLDNAFGKAARGWEMQAWYSIVTTPPAQLIPMQCFPHVDGTDPNQLAMMLYLHETDHGGTAFFRHRSTGLSSLTAQTYPRYQQALQHDVQQTGLPSPAYVTDGGPHFERIHVCNSDFNRAIFYRGNVLHSGIIDNSAPLPADPRTGRLTINAFFRPAV